ncbi:hypothetical protein [Providencia heimbachae]|uniref:Uncharacterized protein n=1 Tax=Providencia heimbachae ATCC 35613 TaxID=1354272 RepID=A0A1B7JLW5_9GAMM|nr:hypothetical protein [Providencia heimbachae]OAT48842.1 hypothetical protein M998_3201 [Providencia heimbachae ATCC 35613]SQH12421.1 Uncharacterised protein [Providencia heimbachae]
MKKLLLIATMVLFSFGSYANEGKEYTVEQLRKMIEDKEYPAISAYKETGSGDMDDVKSCKDRVVSRSVNFSEYPITVEQDVENEIYESVVWMPNYAQKVICEIKDDKARGTQLDATYK